ncbi:MAG TPA: CIA30 family protein [Thermoanaerobaculia bacterium]|jgi:imidazolonepropionase-like amidohydrolase
MLIRLLLLLSLLFGPALQAGVVFRNARLFDGTAVLASTDVLVEDGRIAAVGKQLKVPEGTQSIDAAGKTLLPGLIDAHVHVYGDAAVEALMFGVTTELDQFTLSDFAASLRAEQAAGKAGHRADVFSAGILATVPKGHGTEYGFPIPTLTTPAEAQAFVDARLAEGSDWIKIVYDDGKAYGISYPTLDEPTMRALIEAAHKRKKLAVVHIGTLAGARAAIGAGADGLVHLFADRAPDAELGAFIAQHQAFVIPTLVVLKSLSSPAGGGASLVNDERLKPYLNAATRMRLEHGFPPRPKGPATTYAAAEASVRQLQKNNVPILAGSDAPNPGTAHGAALHRELELLVAAGLTPVEALRAATSAPAKAFRLADRGRIAKGLRADLLLVNGDATKDITATRDIAGIWKAGVPVDRTAWAKNVAAEAAAVAAPPRDLASGAISNFETGTPVAAFGTPWTATADDIAGGASTGTVTVADGGAAGTAKSLAINGTIDAKIPYAWYGAMWSPTSTPMQPANLSSKTELHFYAKGDGRTYRVMLFTRAGGMMPLSRTFVAGPQWTEVTMPWKAFGTDGKDIMTIIFAGGPQPGAFALQVDEVELR